MSSENPVPSTTTFGSVNPTALLSTKSAATDYFSFDEKTGKFSFNFTETGKGYGDAKPTSLTAVHDLNLEGQDEMKFELRDKPVEMWGINWAATVTAIHKDGSRFEMFLPGLRMYDPAGMTGDPHASERVGDGCAFTQVAVSMAQLGALSRGATTTEITAIQREMSPIIQKYHGRSTLFRYMFDQVCRVAAKSDVLPYPEFIMKEAELRMTNLDLDSREHTRQYLISYQQNKPRPPPAYYAKVAAKDASYAKAVAHLATATVGRSQTCRVTNCGCAEEPTDDNSATCDKCGHRMRSHFRDTGSTTTRAASKTATKPTAKPVTKHMTAPQRGSGKPTCASCGSDDLGRKFCMDCGHKR